MRRALVAARICVAALVAASTAALVAGSGVARADGFSIERYEPTPAGEWFVAVPHPWYSSTRWFAGGLTLDYGHDVLLGGLFDPRFHETVAIVEHELVGHVDVAGSFLDRVQVSASLPVVLLERGTPAFGAAPISGAAVGDVRLGAMVRLFGHADKSRISLHVGGYVWIPVGTNKDYAGDQTARGLPMLVASGMLIDHLRWSLSAGVLVRAQQTIGFGPASSTASELQLGAGIAFADHARRFHVGPELNLGTLLVGAQAGTRYGTSVELLLAGQVHVAKMIMIGAAVAPGLATMIGTPDVRALVRVAYAPVRKPPAPRPPPPPPDADHDGVPDAEDQCPTQPGTARGCPDADKDGVPDAEDVCPNTPPGDKPDPTKKGCPRPDVDEQPTAQDIDADKDGVPDAQDVCPGVAPGAHPDPARPGCPLPDADNDGVPDAEDACPKDAGEPNGDTAKNGCPKLTITPGRSFELRSVHFETNKWDLLPESFPILDEVARFLDEHKELRNVVIEGHADDRGTHAWNMRLSRHRAQSVVEYLVKKGIKRARLSFVGFGDTRPLNPERTDEARAQNRRVEVRFPDVKGAPTAPAPLSAPPETKPEVPKPEVPPTEAPPTETKPEAPKPATPPPETKPETPPQ